MTIAPIKWLEKKGVGESETKPLLDKKCVPCLLTIVNEFCQILLSPILNADTHPQTLDANLAFASHTR